ncbi:E3 ubiquitin-protein ligase HERC2-like [Hoplias malabaricus]|uniref:E3 ubiquitin-protein ligase HERC2-like n=1 Tax=Hoplias malabaricus TaxID=27720 RepID=UPI0034638313
MFCYWGDDVVAGFGLVKSDAVKKTDSGVYFCSPKTTVRLIAPGKDLLGLVRGDGNVSVIRAPRAGGHRSSRPKNVELKDKIRLMSCGESQAVLLTYGGKTLRIDKLNSCSPIKELSGMDVIQVACGDQHCMALTYDGQLFTWGQNSSGQLGLGRNDPSSSSPRPLRSLCGIPLAQISAGGDHSFALSLSGAVFGWGRNSAGQLGLGDTEDRHIPACVNSVCLKKTVFISCGGEHTATLSKGGTVFTFGSGRYGQLGHNSFRDELRPRVVGELWGSKVSQISCGRRHTLVLVGSKTIYSFGCGEQGQLGNGRKINQCVPLRVQLPPEVHHHHRVELIISGESHSFVLCSQEETDSNSKQDRGILILEDKMIDRWLSECDSKQWKTIKMEIKTVFSSTACLNGSFIKKSFDGHYQTSTSFSGLDLESVRASVERLAKKEKVLTEVEKIVEKTLLPSLGSSAPGVEALRVFLILPEILRVLNKPEQESQLTAELASAILRLNPCMLYILENYWSELPDDFLKPLVDLFRKPSAYFIYQTAYEIQGKSYAKFLKKSVPVLQMLYQAFCRGQREMTCQVFVIYEINDLLIMLDAANRSIYEIHMDPFWYSDIIQAFAEIDYLQHTLDLLKCTPCIFNLEAKCNFLKFRANGKAFRLVLRRTAVLEDCLLQLRDADEKALKGWLQVMYAEKLAKTDVNKKDFFHHAFSTLLTPDSGMFLYNDTKTLMWFPSEPTVPEERYFLFGCLCGLAFYNNSVANLPFPLALFKKLVNIQPSLDDLTEFSPVIGRSLQYILEYSDEDIDSMDMSFSIMWENKEVELDTSEPGKAITSSNRKEFVEAYVDYTMNKSVERVFEEFRRGFYKVCDRDLVEFFQPEELKGVMVGTEQYDWDTLKKNASYEGVFEAKHPTIIFLWEVFDELSHIDKKAFLLFLTGFDRVPILGMNQVKMRVRPLYKSTEDHLPEALTCHSLLELPMYQTKEVLRAKLTEALHHKRGFWEELHGVLSYDTVIVYLASFTRPSCFWECFRSYLMFWGELNPVEDGEGWKDILALGRVTELSAKHRLLAFLTADGKVTVVSPRNGPSKGEQDKTQTEGKARSSYRKYYISPKEHIELISSGQSHVVLVSKSGTVQQWSCSQQTNRSFSSLTNKQIAQVACGNDHSLVLTKDGQLFTWGQNSSGQLGLGRNEPSSSSPQPLRSLCGIPLAQISAGGDHSFALSVSGAVFGWGRNSAGQLGLGDREDRDVPSCVKSLNLKKTVFISCGEDHTAVLTKEGLVFTFGSGCYGQLGHNSLRDELQPRLLAGLWGSEVSQIACGRYHTLALVGTSKTIYSFGCGEQGQLGNGQRTNQCVPLSVHLPSECDPKQTVDRIIAGGNLSVVYFQDGEIDSASASPSSCRGISVLDDDIIERWFSDCEKGNDWNRVKRGIKRMFSSASIINRSSFIDKSDKHYKTAEGHSGLDLSLARLTFEKLAKKQKILSEVENVVKQYLLPSLGSSAVGVEALRVYLILPELLRVMNKIKCNTQLTVALASSILNLNQESLNILMSLWTRLPYSYYRTVVKTFHSASAHFISQMTTTICNYWTDVEPPLSVLRKLYVINGQRVVRLMDDHFYIKELTVFFESVPSLHTNDEQYPAMINFMKHIKYLLSYPFILDMRCKCTLFRCFHVQDILTTVPPPVQNYALCVRRDMVLVDTLQYLKMNVHDFTCPLKVKFSEEDGYDAGGLRKEFFTLLGKDITKCSSVLKFSEDSRLSWFSSDTCGSSEELYLLGTICGMALYNYCFIIIGFPLALFKKLLNISPTLSDLEELSPVEARSLKNMLKEDEEVVDMLYLDFTLLGKELIPNGREITVTKVNRQKYVDLYVDFVFNKSVENQFREFARGFSRGAPFGKWKMFLPEELRLLLYGTSEYVWEDLRKITTYEHCGPFDQLIQNFWMVFTELSEELKKRFLLFMYATDRLPFGGLSQLRLKIVRHNFSDADERFPVAQTCFGTLDLPNYSSIQILRDRLTHAITCCEVFGKS